MALHFTNTDNVGDNATLELTGARAVTTAVIGGITYLFVGSETDDGVSVFVVAADGTLANVDNVTDAGLLELDAVRDLATAVVGGTTYLFATGFLDDGVSVFSVAANGTLTNVDNVDDGEDAALELDGATSVTTAVIGGTTYLFVTGFFDDGVSVFSVAANGTLTHVDSVDDGDDAALQINEPRYATTAVVGGNTYLFVPGDIDNGLSVFSVAANGALTNVDNVSDDATLELLGAHSTTTAVVGGTTYLFVTGSVDDGVSVFSVAADGTLTNVDNVTDDATLGLDGANAMTTAVIGGTTYLFITSGSEDALVAFSVAADGTLTHVANVVDDATLELDAASDVTMAVVGGISHLFVPGQFDDGVSVFSLDGEVPLLGDVLWQHGDGTPATAGHELPAVSANFQIRGTGDFDGDGDADILWRHSEGLTVTWEMENGDLLTTHNFGVVGTTWQIAGTGDFDGDGDDDILWRHTEGLTVIWEMEDAAFVTNHNLPQVSTSFQIAGTGDFDGDGDADILWRGNQGQVVTWEMEDAAFVTNHNLAVVPTNFAITGTEDFDSDGDSDILWRHTGGLTVTWEMEGAGLLQTNNFGIVSNGWQIRGTGEFDLV
jgi:6-phosphogluconolactonase (cycloisomerase 2 family)